MKAEETKLIISDYLEVKRKRFWAKRFAVIDNQRGLLYYKDKKESHTVKHSQKLKDCDISIVKKEHKSTGTLVVAITKKDGDALQSNLWIKHLTKQVNQEPLIPTDSIKLEKPKASIPGGKLFTVSDEVSGSESLSDNSPNVRKVALHPDSNIRKAMLPDSKVPLPPLSTPETVSKIRKEMENPTGIKNLPKPLSVPKSIPTNVKVPEQNLPKMTSQIIKPKELKVSNVAKSALFGVEMPDQKVPEIDFDDNKQDVSELPSILQEKEVVERKKSFYVEDENTNLHLLRLEELEKKNWIFNKLSNGCRIYTENILLPVDLHNPLIPIPPKRKESKFLQKLSPYFQLILDIIILSSLLFALNYIFKAKSGYTYELICYGIISTFVVFKIMTLLVAQGIISKIRNKKQPVELKQAIINPNEFCMKVDIKVGDTPFEELIEIVSSLKHRRNWEPVDDIREKRGSNNECILTYIMDNLTTKEIPMKRAYKMRNKNEFVLLEKSRSFDRGYIIQQTEYENTTNLVFFCSFFKESIEIYPKIPIFLYSLVSYLCRMAHINQPIKAKVVNSSPRTSAYHKGGVNINPSYINNLPYSIKNENCRQRIEAILRAQGTEIPTDIYGSQITNPLYEKSDIKLIQKGREAVKDLITCIKEDGKWKICLRGNKDVDKYKDYSLFTYIEDGYMALKTICTIPFAPIEVLDYILNLDKKKELYKGYMKESKLALRLPKNTAILHEQMEKQWPVSARDYAILLHYNLATNGSINMVYTSIDHPKVPEIKGFQRGTLKISGWTLEKTEQGETMATHVIMMQITRTITTKIFTNYLRKNEGETAYNLMKAMNNLYSD